MALITSDCAPVQGQRAGARLSEARQVQVPLNLFCQYIEPRVYVIPAADLYFGRILSLDGGGVRGVYTAAVLARLVEREPRCARQPQETPPLLQKRFRRGPAVEWMSHICASRKALVAAPPSRAGVSRFVSSDQAARELRYDRRHLHGGVARHRPPPRLPPAGGACGSAQEEQEQQEQEEEQEQEQQGQQEQQEQEEKGQEEPEEEEEQLTEQEQEE